MSDRAVYLGMLIVGFFFVMLGWLFAPEYWGLFALGYLALMAYLINFSVLDVYRGKHLANWRQSLARIPLRTVGYGTKEGRPLDAAHDHPETFRALTWSLIISLIVLAAATLVIARWTL